MTHEHAEEHTVFYQLHLDFRDNSHFLYLCGQLECPHMADACKCCGAKDVEEFLRKLYEKWKGVRVITMF